ncbi:MAG TPA: nucleotidyltransferase domain-containing protein [Herpetosiphonaceae bacterium]
MQDTAILHQVLDLLQAEFGAELLGVLATGSRIRGEGDRTSDIDLPVVINQPRRQRRNIVVEGVEVEMFLNPPFQVRCYFADDRACGRGAEQHMWTTGQILYDPQGVMAELQAEAREQWFAGPPPLSTTGRWLARYSAADGLRDIEDVLHTDPDRAMYLIGSIVPDVVNTLYRIHRRWLVKPKRVLLDLATWDATAAELAVRACSGSASQRFAALQQLVIHTLTPLDGPMPLSWSIDWEELQS